MTYNIVTSVAVDTDEIGGGVRYPSLGTSLAGQRREIYWKCAAVFCWVSRAVNPAQKHYVYTNEASVPIIDGVDVETFLTDLDVDVVHLPFDCFDPKDHSRSFRNAFYKLDVLRSLAIADRPSILLDSDVVWRQQSAELDQILSQGDRLLVQDTYQRSATPDAPNPHNLSMRAMGDTFRQIDPAYPVSTPVWWGGELIGGGPAILSSIVKGITEAFPLFLAASERVRFANGWGLLDGDEYVASFVYNQLGLEPVDTYRRFSRRIGTLPGRVDAWHEDNDIPIWHLLNEKRRGFEVLFQQLRTSPGPLSEWNSRGRQLGDYFGVPRPGEFRTWRRRVWRPKDLKMEAVARWHVRKDRSWNPK